MKYFVFVSFKKWFLQIISNIHWLCLGQLPRDKGAHAVIDYLVDNLGNEDCVKQALIYLAELTKDESNSLDDMGKRVVMKAMKDYISEAEVQTVGFIILENLVVFGKWSID